MPKRPSSPTHRRPGVALVALALVAVLLAGCGRQTDPTSYSAGVRTNFVEGCVKGFTAKPTILEKKNDTAICQCVIGKVTLPEAQGGIKFSDFAAAESKLRGDPVKNRIDKLLPKLVTFLDACTNKVTPTTVSVGPRIAPTSTTVAAATTTTKPSAATSTTAAAN